jgi:hypothetical protein
MPDYEWVVEQRASYRVAEKYAPRKRAKRARGHGLRAALTGSSEALRWRVRYHAEVKAVTPAEIRVVAALMPALPVHGVRVSNPPAAGFEPCTACTVEGLASTRLDRGRARRASGLVGTRESNGKARGPR